MQVYENPFKPVRAVEYECGNVRKAKNGCPDQCPQCGAGVKSV